MPFNDLFFGNSFPTSFWPLGQWPYVIIVTQTGMPTYNFVFENPDFISEKYQKINLKNQINNTGAFCDSLDQTVNLRDLVSNPADLKLYADIVLDILPRFTVTNPGLLFNHDTNSNLELNLSSTINIKESLIPTVDLNNSLDNNARYFTSLMVGSTTDIYYYTFVSGGTVGGTGDFGNPFIISETIDISFYIPLILAVYESLGIEYPVFMEI
jgi:hypothetical protein